MKDHGYDNGQRAGVVRGRAVPEAALEVPPRVIPLPASVSHEARAFLASPPMPSPDYPAPDDPAGWRALAEAHEEVLLRHMSRRNVDGVEVGHVHVDDARVYVITPPDADQDDPRVYLDIHGGALFVGGGDCCRATGTSTAQRVRMRTWAVDYRMPPDHPYPAALDDCVTVYRALLKERSPQEIVVGGASAGGNLVAALLLRARDEGLPLPAAALLLSPELDLTESGDSFRTNLGVDTVLTRGTMAANLLYAGDHDLTDPYLSPLFGDFSAGFPPTLLASGTRDLFLSNAVRMHRALRAAGIPADLHVGEAAPHGLMPPGTPEDEELLREIRRFIEVNCPAPRSGGRVHQIDR
ncbi:alpha/beta hydrolase [Streptomyces sp. NPDC058683]|uniref:alpha/beta hydrolase n=1 Tax=Streptomyces sp. NPDC058683 TaxID=3346597 RepID=UPI003668ABC6